MHEKHLFDLERLKNEKNREQMRRSQVRRVVLSVTELIRKRRLPCWRPAQTGTHAELKEIKGSNRQARFSSSPTAA